MYQRPDYAKIVRTAATIRTPFVNNPRLVTVRVR